MTIGPTNLDERINIGSGKVDGGGDIIYFFVRAYGNFYFGMDFAVGRMYTVEKSMEDREIGRARRGVSGTL